MRQSLQASSKERPLLLHCLRQVALAGNTKWSSTSPHTRPLSPTRNSKCMDHQWYEVYPVVGLYLPHIFQPKSSPRRHLFRLSVCMGIAKHATVLSLVPLLWGIRKASWESLPLFSIAEAVLRSCWVPCGWEPASVGSYGEGTYGKRSVQQLQHKIPISGGPQHPAGALIWNRLQYDRHTALELSAAALLEEQHVVVCPVRFKCCVRTGPWSASTINTSEQRTRKQQRQHHGSIEL